MRHIEKFLCRGGALSIRGGSPHLRAADSRPYKRLRTLWSSPLYHGMTAWGSRFFGCAFGTGICRTEAFAIPPFSAPQRASEAQPGHKEHRARDCELPVANAAGIRQLGTGVVFDRDCQ